MWYLIGNWNVKKNERNVFDKNTWNFVENMNL